MSDDNQARGLVFLEKMRLSFPHLAAAHASAPGATPKFSADFIMDPSSPSYAQFWAQAHAKAVERWGDQADAIINFIMQDRKLRCFGNGEEIVDKQTLQPMVGYAGAVYIKANNENQPVLFDANGERLMDARKFYGGCYVNAQVQPWIQDNQHGRAIRCELVGVQFVADGEAFGVKPVDPTTLFNPVAGAPPAQAAPGQAPAGYPAPGQAPAQAAPGQAPGGYPAPGQAPAQAAPGQPPAGYPAPGQAPAQAAPGQPPAGYPAPGQAPAQAAPGQAPGGYDPSLYNAPQPAPVAPEGAPAHLGVPGSTPGQQ